MLRADREIKDIDKIKEILAKSEIIHLALIDGDYPHIVPLHYGYEFEDGRITFYMHGARKGFKLDLIRSNPNVCAEIECDIELESGGDVACMYGSFYASIIGRGKASIVEDNQEKIKGLKLLMKNQTGRDFEINEKMAAAVAVIKIEIDSYTAKGKLSNV